MTTRPLIVGLGGTTRDGSRTELALAVALRACARAGADVAALTGQQLVLPIYAPGSELVPAARKLIEMLRQCNGVIVATPSYHGGVSGMIKNALDYTEELRDDVRPYLHGRAVGSIVCAGGWQNVGSTLVGVRSIIHALRAWPTPLGVGINTQMPVFDEAGECGDERILMQLETMGRQVVEFGRMQLASQHAHRPGRVDKQRTNPIDFRQAITAN